MFMKNDICIIIFLKTTHLCANVKETVCWGCLERNFQVVSVFVELRTCQGFPYPAGLHIGLRLPLDWRDEAGNHKNPAVSRKYVTLSRHLIYAFVIWARNFNYFMAKAQISNNDRFWPPVSTFTFDSEKLWPFTDILNAGALLCRQTAMEKR